ncbi:hypothetical protein, partial [uncultured Ruegeria sp.]|uniref:hypothetical protein n=1 Tax=uncultured Ruegeria sp. TaxID=259304 RepID=UPI00260A3344
FGLVFAIRGPPFHKHNDGPVQLGRLNIVSAFACALLPVAAAVRSDTGGYISLCKRWEKVVLSNKMIMHSMITLGLLVVFLQASIKSRASGSRWPGSTFHPSMDLFRKL